MTGMLRLLKYLSVVSVLVGGGLVVWRGRDAVRHMVSSRGGVEGITGSANRLLQSAGSVRDLVSQVARLK